MLETASSWCRIASIPALTLISALMVSITPVAGQYTTASFGGTVLDSTGATVPGARVAVRNVNTGLKQTTASDSAGAFLFSRLPIGDYELTVEKEGFATYVQTGITLTVNQAATQTVTLKVGDVSQNVRVEADSELIETRSATTGQLVNTRQVVDLPLNGRMAQSLVFLAAGTVDLTDRYCGEDCHGGVYPGTQTAGVNGAGPGQVNYQLDGAGHNDTYLNYNLPFPNPDAIQEFNLQSSNFSAQYGNAGGGVVNIVTRSGTNDFHGSAFEFLRNGALNARNFFAPRQDTLKRNQFGGSLGGPIIKNKVFFFGTYQGTRIRSASEGQIAFVPTEAERRGDFSAFDKPLIDPLTNQPFPNNRIPEDRLSTAAQFFLDPKWIPLPGSGRQLTYAGQGVGQTENQVMGRVDYNFGGHQLNGRYFFTDFDRPAIVPSQNLLTAEGFGNAVRVQNVAFNHTWVANPQILLTSTFGWNRQRGGSSSSAPFSFPDAGVKIAATDPPELSIWGIAGGFGVETNHLGQFDRGDFTIRENLTVNKGEHELHFGGEAVRISNHIINTFLQNGYFEFDGRFTGDGLADFVLGRASGFGQGGGEYKLLRGTKWGFYVQDNWRMSARFSLNLGLRWDPYFPFYDREGRVACFQPGVRSQRYPNAPVGLTYGGEDHDPGCPVGGSDNNLGNFAPRLGFAYRINQSGTTSLRGGVGYYYTPPPANQFNPFTNIAPFAPGFFFNNVSFDDPFGSAGVPNPFPEQYGPRVPGPEATFITPTTIRAVFAPDFRLPQLITWNLNLEHQIGRSWVARIGYQGNKGTYMSSGAKNTRELNPAIYIPGQSTTENTQERRRYQDFSTIGIWESAYNTHYNSLQLNLERRFAAGLSVLTNYTWAKMIDDYGGTNPFNRRFDRGPSDDDVNHVFKFANVWEIPRAELQGWASKLVNGWALNSIIFWRSGFPFSIYSGRDNSLSGVAQDRADFLGGDAKLSSDRPHGEMIEQFFDTSRFVQNAIGTFGNSGKNVMRGPRLFNVDLGAFKTTPVAETVSVQFRAEFFNAFNNVNFNGPDNYVSSGQFGRITSARSPRILQFALKLLF